jgi:hypothetical protein
MSSWLGRQWVLQIKLTGMEDLLRQASFFDPKVFQKASRDGIVYAGKSVPPAAAKNISAKYNIPSARIKQDIKISSYLKNDTVEIYFANRPPSAGRFGARDGMKPGKGLSIQIFRGGARVAIPRGFLQREKGSSPPALLRPYRAWRRKPDSRQVEFLYGPSIGRIYGGASRYGQVIRSDIAARTNDQYVKGVERSLNAQSRGYSR